MHKSGKWILGISAAALVGAAIISHDDNDAGITGQAAVDDTLDYARPLYSVEGMTTCEGVPAFSKIAGDLQGHFTPKYESYGCRMWPDGMQVQVISKIGPYRHVEFPDLDGTRVSDFTLFTMLRNAPLAVPPQTPTARGNSADLVPQPSASVQSLIDQEQHLNDKCRDGSGDNSDTFKACDEREAILRTIENKGWCWKTPDGVDADSRWTQCASTAP